MITVKHSGDFKKVEKFTAAGLKFNALKIIERYAKQGVRELAAATPEDTGLTADSWGYEIKKTRNGYSIDWTNSNSTTSGIPIVVLIAYGHGTRNGGYVQGRDFVNPSIRPILDAIATKIYEEVSRL